MVMYYSTRIQSFESEYLTDIEVVLIFIVENYYIF